MKRYVKVIKQPQCRRWYQEGELYEFNRSEYAGGETYYRVNIPSRGHTRGIVAKDAMLFETENRNAVSGEQVLVTRDYKEYKRGNIIRVGKVTDTGHVIPYEAHRPYWETGTVIRRNSYEVIVKNAPQPFFEAPPKSVKVSRVIDPPSFVVGDKTREVIHKFTAKLHELQLQFKQELEEVALYEHSRGFKDAQMLTESPVNFAPFTLRKSVVLAAKEDVERLTKLGAKELYSVRFVMKNRASNCVTALVYRPKIGQQYVADPAPDHIGVAKCRRSDCFNIYIGKAIALRRALKLEIPEEYLNVQPPTGHEVGDFVTLKSSPNRVAKVVSAPYDDVLVVRYCKPNSRETYLTQDELVNVRDIDRVVDDSERYV
ncbi:hypothetical protein F373_gp070 [Bacillus phage SP-10]|uniref:hypothetical protein n=1 Tax=Bacillus phage SP10 TaxID=941058 RepID=UPI0002198B1A|nr:hypothetical protein F373_gp070 [Bacillus phage SP-10]BAK52882.1 hypothetical protein [Bacillus phage SP-10]